MNAIVQLNQYASPAAFFAANRLSVNASRPFIDKNGEPCVFVNQNGKPVKMRANAALLRYDEWKDIDRPILALTGKLLGHLGSRRLAALNELLEAARERAA